jgi:glucosamine--fructose-6-phosphate aminotransferase (isomerizing)
MCGIIAGLSKTNIEKTLLEGLARLEYRGYDSAGLVIIDDNSEFQRHRASGKVKLLKEKCQQKPLTGYLGVAHTRWATHGAPSVDNAHPHICNNQLALVHNGIIENHEVLRKQQKDFRFTSDTDTETLVHQISVNYQDNLLEAVKKTVTEIEGAYAFGVIDKNKQELIATRQGSPLVLGIGEQGFFVSSDVSALLGVVDKFVFLEELDIVHITKDSYQIYDKDFNKCCRKECQSDLELTSLSKQGYAHFMLKEIYEQPVAIKNTLLGRLTKTGVNPNVFGINAKEVFQNIKQIQIIACGTSYNAGLVAKYWLEDIAKIPTHIEVASEYRYRNPIILDDTLFITISQSGETADTLEALRAVKKCNNKLHSLSICNSAESSLTRESELVFLTHAGPEIGVASTKAFTTQLVSLALLSVAIGKCRKQVSRKQEKSIVDGLNRLPGLITKALKQEGQIIELAKTFKDKFNALFLGRGAMHAIAMEGALKLKEISYIHAEAFPAGELKHGPIALIDQDTPVIAVAPNDALLDKLKSNLQEGKSRGSQMIVFEDEMSNIESMEGMDIIPITHNLGRITAPIIFTIPLQLLSYHVALIKGTNVDQPRNLAKSVTVE